MRLSCTRLRFAVLALATGCAGAPDAGGGAGGPGDTADDTAADTAHAAVDPPAGPACGGMDWPAALPANVLGARVVEGRADDAETLASLDALIAALPALPGPWGHALRGPWRADADGTWSAPPASIEAASVPDVVVDDAGRTWLFHVDGDLAALRARAAAGEPMDAGWAGIGGLAAVVSDDGASWTPAPLSFSPDAATGRPLFLVDPDIVRLPDGRWRLYALRVDADGACADTLDPALQPGPPRLWAAESADLQAWTELGTAWTAPAGATDPAVWCPTDTTCYAAVTYQDANLGFARSDDGGQSFADAALDVGPDRLAMPDVARLAGADGADGADSWAMVAQGPDGGLVRLTSANGEAWSAPEGLGFGGFGPSVAADAGEAVLWTAEEAAHR